MYESAVAYFFSSTLYILAICEKLNETQKYHKFNHTDKIQSNTRSIHFYF